MTRRAVLDRWALPALVVLVLLVGAWLRLGGNNWDEERQINVDENYVSKMAVKKVNLPPGTTLATLLDSSISPLNPRTGGEFFVYGTLPVYVVKGVAVAASAATGDRYLTALPGVTRVGRVVVSLLDLLTALLVFAVAARLRGVWTGLLACALYSFAVLPIHFSHFFITDPFMTMFMTGALLASLSFYQTGRLRYLVVAGVMVGLALACKLSAWPAAALPIMAVALRLLVAREGHDRVDWRRAAGQLMVAGASALAALFVTDPYAVLDAAGYVGILSKQAAIQGGDIDQWFSRKYVGTWPVLHLLGQLLLIGAGPLTGIAGAVGVVVSFRPARRWREALVLAGALLYFASIAAVDIKWVRYLLPLVPYLCIFAAGGVVWLAARARQSLRTAAAVAGALALVALLGGASVSAVFTSEHTQIRASRWLYEHAPAGSRIGMEVTAIDLPLPMPGYDDIRAQYTFVPMDPLADLPSKEASATLRDQLRKADYLIIDATQAAGTVGRLPWRYPVQIRYYDLLLSGRLGYSVALHATSYPRIGPWEIPDDGGWVDPSFMDSSHPPTYVLKKERDLTDEEWSALFAEAEGKESVPSRKGP